VADRRIRHIPVIDDKGMVGMVSIGDVVRAVVSEYREELDRLNAYIQGGYWDKMLMMMMLMTNITGCCYYTCSWKTVSLEEFVNMVCMDHLLWCEYANFQLFFFLYPFNIGLIRSTLMSLKNYVVVPWMDAHDQCLVRSNFVTQRSFRKVWVDSRTFM